MKDEGPIVFFDGVCNLCNGFVDFLMREDRQKIIRYGSLQGRTAERVLGSEVANELRSIVLVVSGRTPLVESDAVLEILSRLPFPWPLFSTLRVFPRFFRNGVYRWVARNRYRFFGKRETCRLPTSEERALFVD